MKKSCSGKESKVVRNKDIEPILNDSKEYSKKQLVEEEVYINKKLSESGIEDEDLSWLEKRNIFKTINVSLNTAGSERLQRSSPRLAKTSNSRAPKWVENSFETTVKEDSQNSTDNNDKCVKTRSNKEELQLSSTPAKKPNSLPASKVPSQEIQKTTSKANTKQGHSSDSTDKVGNEVDVNCDSSNKKSSKKVYYIKVQVEETSKKELCASAEGSSSEESISENQGTLAGKKRASPPEPIVDGAKKLKMDPTNSKNGMCLSEEKSLQIELELERQRHSAPFKIRDIKTIVAECEFRNKKWKETFSKYKCPARWGIPIVRNCSEKWDGKQIPPKLLQRYQKYLSSNNLCHPVFFPTKSQSNNDLSNGEISSQSSAGGNLESEDESGNKFKEMNQGEGVFTQDEKEKFSLNNSANSALENNLNASTSVSDTDGRMVLRNRSQQKPVLLDEDSENEDDDEDDDDSEEWLTKQKPIKKQKINSRSKKPTAQTNQQLVLKLEKCDINKKNGNEGNRKNGNKNNESFTAGSLGLSPGSRINQLDVNSKSVPDPDTMVCPICSLRFKKQLIESHATECASKTYKD